MKLEEKILEVNFGPQHPATHGVLRVKVKLDGEYVLEAQPILGYLHRNAEKLSEMKYYVQSTIFMDRLDYVSAHQMELGYVLAAEKLVEVEAPERANYIRVLFAELNRIASHLVFIAAFGLDAGMMTPFFYCFREREKIIEMYEMTSGARLEYNYFSIGGVYKDLPEGFEEKFKAFYEEFPKKMEEIRNLFATNEIFVSRTKKIGILKPEDAKSLSVTGPVLRASGVPFDIRKEYPYLMYDKLDFDIPTYSVGDVYNRFMIRFDEMKQSLRIAKQVMDKMPGGEYYNQKARKQFMLRLKGTGEVYSRTESSRGEFGIYLIGDGTPKPYRVRIRSPTFHNMTAIPVVSRGYKISDMVLSISSMDPVFGEVDR
ncbi:MAG: NADH-quinone oxidoreductase subunit D [Thermoplasmata archaeon]